MRGASLFLVRHTRTDPGEAPSRLTTQCQVMIAGKLQHPGKMGADTFPISFFETLAIFSIGKMIL